MLSFKCVSTRNFFIGSVESFEFTSESGVFDLFQVPLYHGWLVDPQDLPTYEIVSKLSYNQLVEMIINNRSSTEPGNLQKGLCYIFMYRVGFSMTYFFL